MALLTADTPAWAAPALSGSERADSSVARDLTLQREEEEAVAEVVSGDSGSSENTSIWVGLPTLTVPADGEACVRIDWVQRDQGDDVDAERDEAWELVESLYDETPFLQDQEIETCPYDDEDALPAQLVHEMVREPIIDELPRPELSVPPGYALTGMPAYLVTGHELTYQRPEPLTLDFHGTQFTVDVTGHATMYVDWDDGNGEIAYDQPGKPYPDGQVRNTYADRGNTHITVVDEWTLHYTVQANGQTIIEDTVPAFRLPEITHDLDVREYRAVLTNPDTLE